MFSVFVYIFSAVISFWGSRYFFLRWKKNKYDPYWEFWIFFILLGTSFIVYVIPFLTHTFLIFGVWAAEIGNFLTLCAFVFILRAFAKFQNIAFLSNYITFFAVFFTVVKFFIGLSFPASPMFFENLIYWHYPPVNYITFSALLFLFTTLMAITLLYNIKNISIHKKQIFYLGIAFFIGGIGGSFIVIFNSFLWLLSGYFFLFITFFFATLFLITASRSEKEVSANSSLGK